MSTLDLPNQWYAYGPSQLFAYNDIIVLNYLKSKKYENENNSNKSEINQSMNACTNRLYIVILIPRALPGGSWKA